MNKFSKLLAIKILYFLKRRGENAAWLAETSGVTAGQISRIMTGRTNPTIDTLVAIAKALEVPLVRLLEETSVNAIDSVLANGGRNKLSATVIPGPLLAADGAVILSELASITPAQRSLILAILFRDATLFSDGKTEALSAVLRDFQKAE